METTIPVSNVGSRNAPISNVPPRTVPVTNVPMNTVPTTKIVADSGRRHLTRIFYYLAFVTLLAALVLSIIAIVRDDLTRMTYHTSTSRYHQYCGWRDVHSYETSSGLATTTYHGHCSNSNNACEAVSVGKAWFSILIIAIAFGGFALISFILDFTLPFTFIAIFLCEIISFIFLLADSLQWGIANVCTRACNRLQWAPSDVVHCNSRLGVSWILVVIAGGLTIISMICLLISRSILNKRY